MSPHPIQITEREGKTFVTIVDNNNASFQRLNDLSCHFIYDCIQKYSFWFKYHCISTIRLRLMNLLHWNGGPSLTDKLLSRYKSNLYVCF